MLARRARTGEKVTCPKGKSTCPGRPDGVFFEPWPGILFWFVQGNFNIFIRENSGNFEKWPYKGQGVNPDPVSIAQYCRSFVCITSSYFSFHTGNIKIELWWVLLQSFTMQTTPLTRLSYFTLLLTLVRSIQCIISYWEISMPWVHLVLHFFTFFFLHNFMHNCSSLLSHCCYIIPSGRQFLQIWIFGSK